MDRLSNKLTAKLPGTGPLISWAIFPAILLVYLLFPTKNYYWDGIFFARVIEAAQGIDKSLLHPNHLFYNVVGYALYHGAKSVGLSWRAIEVLQLANSVVSVLTAYLMSRILRRTVRSVYLVLALTLLFAFSATWWKFSTDANAYVFSLFCLLLSFYFTLNDFKPRPLLVTLIFSAAVLLHQLAVIAYPAIALSLFWQVTDSPRERAIGVVKFCILSFVLVFTTYYLCFYLATGTLSIVGFSGWVSSYSPDASFSFDLLSNLGYTLRGNVRLFFNARLSFLKGLISPAIVVVITIFVVVVLLWLVAVVRGTRWRELLSGWPPAGKTFATPHLNVFLIWIGLYLLFLFCWLPHNTFYRLFYLPAIILLAGECMVQRKPDVERPTFRLGLFVAVMGLSNFLFFIYPNTQVEKYPPLSLALEMNKVWQPGTIVYFQSENSDNNLMAYFNPGIEWRPLQELDRMSVELQRVYDEGKSAWLEASAIDRIKASPQGAEWLGRHGRSETWRERKARGYNVKFIQVRP